jgi:hypothetical protein
MLYSCYKCPECGSTRTRDLDCEECKSKGKDCNLIICCDCGSTVYDKETDKLYGEVV